MSSFVQHIVALGYAGIFAIIFCESGVLIGIVFPGDTLLFAAGLLAAQGYLNIGILLAGSIVAAILGDSTGYYLGRKFGSQIFARNESIFFSKKHVERSEKFFKKHGKKTIFFARYVPIFRTLVPFIAGIAKMEYLTFISWNIIGGIAWSSSVLLAGYFFGSRIPDVDKYILPVIAGVMILSFAPVVLGIIRGKTTRQ